MTANSASSQIRSQVHVLQRDRMISSPSPVGTPRGDAIQIIPHQDIPLEERPLQGPPRPTETPEDATPTGALVNNAR